MQCLEMIKMVAGLSDFGLAAHLKFFEPGQPEEFWLHVHPGSLIVLDEVQNIFNSRDWQSRRLRSTPSSPTGSSASWA